MSASRLFILALVARRLSHAGFGQFIYAQWLIDIGVLLCSFGATGAVTRYVAEFGQSPARVAGFLRRWQAWALGASVAGALAAALGAWLSDVHVGAAGYAFLFLWAASQGLWAMQIAALTGCQRFDLISLSSLAYAAIAVGGIWILPLSDDRPAMLFGLLAMAAAGAASIGIAAVAQRAAGPIVALDEGEWRSIRRYAANMWVTALLTSLVWSRGEYPLVRGLLGNEGLAHYAAAMTLFGGAAQTVMLGLSGMAPYLTDLWGQGRQQAAVATARRIMDVQLLACGAAALTMTLLGRELLGAAFGHAYDGAHTVLAILSLGLVALALSTPNHLLQLATDARFSRNAAITGVALLFMLVLAFLPIFHLPGVALARATSLLLIAFLTGVTAIAKWGSSGVSIQNVGLVTVTVSAAIALVTWRDDLELLQRAALLAVGLVVLAITVRNDNGRIVVLMGAQRFGLHGAPQVEASRG